MTDPLLLGLDGPEVRVTARVASRLARPLADLLRRAQRSGERIDADVVATVAAIETAARAYASHQAAVLGRTAAAGTSAYAAEDDSRMIATMSTANAAKALGCRPRNVRSLAERGTLPGTKVGRVWLFDPADVEGLRQAREKA